MWWGIALFWVIVFILIRKSRKRREAVERAYYKQVKLIWLYAGAAEGLALIEEAKQVAKREWYVRVKIEGQSFEFNVTFPKRANRSLRVGEELPILYNYTHREAVLHPMYCEWLKGDDTLNDYDVGIISQYIQRQNVTN